MPDDAVGVVYVKEAIGFIVEITDGTDIEVQATVDSMIDGTFKVSYIQQQSAAALKAFAVHDVKVSNLNDKLKEFKISDMIDVAPDSLFDDPGIKDTPIDQLSETFQDKLKYMTIQNILDWGNIADIEPEVVSIIGEATLEDFFASLSYSAVDGDIHVNIVKLYDSIYARQNADD